jgi:GNAT superfamily N-acetyltransferase
VVSRGVVHDAPALDSLVAEEDGALVGAVTLRQAGDEAELVTLDSAAENRGVGSALLDAAAAWARERGLRRLWLVTTNDNLRALRFYQRRGWSMCALHRDAVAAARLLKPEIPSIGDHGIPLRHEIEFELLLDQPGQA